MEWDSSVLIQLTCFLQASLRALVSSSSWIRVEGSSVAGSATSSSSYSVYSLNTGHTMSRVCVCACIQREVVHVFVEQY